MPAKSALWLLVCWLGFAPQVSSASGMTTWDGKHSIDQIEVTMVYFVPRDRNPLPDWKDRVEYFARRIEQFHAREYQGQSVLKTKIQPEPFESARTVEQLRSGDADQIFFMTLREVDEALQFGAGERKAFPILLVLSEINWRALDDFYRARTEGDRFVFEGAYSDGRHFPGAKSGGARATYLAQRGVGWGLVSADGWRVPYSGSDCVVYHEGVGHTVGLPHPEPGNGSVMSQGQYRGWISESWLDDDQKTRMGWKSKDPPVNRDDLFSVFRALPSPAVPKPGEEVLLELRLPKDVAPKSVRVRYQTDVWGPWIERPIAAAEPISLGSFDRPTPVSYRVDVTLGSGETAEIWGYFQVRNNRDTPVFPPGRERGGRSIFLEETVRRGAEVDLLAKVDVERDRVQGEWRLEDGVLFSPKAYGARLELPGAVPEEYELTLIAEPLDEPNALNIGLKMGGHRFLALLNYGAGENAASALENVDGQNVGNLTTRRETLFRKGRPAFIQATVRKDSVRVKVDGHEVIPWSGKPSQLSLADYWKTPNPVLFVGSYDCAYRISRITLAPLNLPE